jgi:hypothetical protein
MVQSTRSDSNLFAVRDNRTYDIEDVLILSVAARAALSQVWRLTTVKWRPTLDESDNYVQATIL